MNAGDPLRLALSGDGKAFPLLPTLIRSVVRHTTRPVEVLVYSRTMHCENFTSGRLCVEFAKPRVFLMNRTAFVPPEMFDRFFVLEDKPDWERAFLFDWDQLAVGPLEELWTLDLDGHYGAFVRDDDGRSYKARGWMNRGDWPRSLPGANQPFFRFGGLLNLEHCRQNNLLGSMLELAKAGGSEQAIFASLSRGRYLNVDKKWNVLPPIEEAPPDARVLHWFGAKKPWTHPKIPMAETWHAARCSWGDLIAIA